MKIITFIFYLIKLITNIYIIEIFNKMKTLEFTQNQKIVLESYLKVDYKNITKTFNVSYF